MYISTFHYYEFVFYAEFEIVGVSYFVYGEKINIYSGTDPLQKEFMEAGLDFIQSFLKTMRAFPLYKLFPTKTYRDYERIVRRLQRSGECVRVTSFAPPKINWLYCQWNLWGLEYNYQIPKSICYAV